MVVNYSGLVVGESQPCFKVSWEFLGPFATELSSISQPRKEVLFSTSPASLHTPQMVEGAREAMSGTAPSLLMVSSALKAEALGTERRQLSDSGYASSGFLESLMGPSPHICALQEFR